MSKLTPAEAVAQFGKEGIKFFGIDVSEEGEPEEWVIVTRPTSNVFEVAKAKQERGEADVDGFIARSMCKSHTPEELDKLFEEHPTLKYRLSSGAYDLLEAGWRFSKKAQPSALTT